MSTRLCVVVISGYELLPTHFTASWPSNNHALQSFGAIVQDIFEDFEEIMVARIDPRIENMSGSRQFDCNSLLMIVIGRSGHKTATM